MHTPPSQAHQARTLQRWCPQPWLPGTLSPQMPAGSFFPLKLQLKHHLIGEACLAIFLSLLLLCFLFLHKHTAQVHCHLELPWQAMGRAREGRTGCLQMLPRLSEGSKRRGCGNVGLKSLSGAGKALEPLCPGAGERLRTSTSYFAALPLTSLGPSPSLQAAPKQQGGDSTAAARGFL